MIIVQFFYGVSWDLRPETKSIEFNDMTEILAYIAKHKPRSIRSFFVRYWGSYDLNDVSEQISDALYALDEQ